MKSLKKTISLILLAVAIPAAVIILFFVLGRERYDIASIAVALLSTAAFVLAFERNSANGRLVVLVAVMTALSVAGRFIFSPIAFFKPVTAIVIITAVYFGSESGYITGAFCALLSNFYFGQGPWTPFQMTVWGLIGLLSGLLSKYLKKNTAILALWGGVAGVIFSMVMDVWTTLWAEEGFNLARYFTNVSFSLPIMAIYAASNIIFLLLLAKPIGKKLERIKTKYGIITN